MMRRRDFLKQIGAGFVVWHSPSIIADTINQEPSRKLVWIVLRGAVDSLHTVMPGFEQELTSLRPTLAPTIADKVLPIDEGFALHPSLTNLHQWYKQKELLPIVAVSTGYRKRSHFDGQDFLECGLKSINHNTGWLARAIEQKHQKALAIHYSIPLSLRNSDKAGTWYPSRLESSPADIYEKLIDLYQFDEQLKMRLASGLEIRETTGMGRSSKRIARFVDLTTACSKLMTTDNGVNCAMLELGGWDTHNNQNNRLTKKLTELDNGLLALKQGLGTHWHNTAVVIATEFGRTVKENGTKGTDHGTGSVLMLAGGAISGGKVLGDWPGIDQNKLFEGRDLMPTTNSFAWIASILEQHWEMDSWQLDKVFPGVKPYNYNLIS